MVHPMVEQLRFARSEFRRCIDGVAEDDARKRLLPMNCISWNVGHLAWQEQRTWLTRAQGLTPFPELNRQFAFGSPACEPSLAEVWQVWQEITAQADPWLDALTTETLEAHVVAAGKPTELIFGSLMHRMIYHYWYHTGENAAIRQQLGHTALPDFVGDIDYEAPYRAER